jgi:hypothetical protein
MRTMVLFATGAALALGGCVDSLNNRDTVTFGVGNAVAANRAIHTDDPWNPVSRETDIASSGDAVLAARQRRLLLPPGEGATVLVPLSGTGAMPPAE